MFNVACLLGYVRAMIFHFISRCFSSMPMTYMLHEMGGGVLDMAPSIIFRSNRCLRATRSAEVRCLSTQCSFQHILALQQTIAIADCEARPAPFFNPEVPYSYVYVQSALVRTLGGGRSMAPATAVYRVAVADPNFANCHRTQNRSILCHTHPQQQRYCTPSSEPYD